MNRIEKRIIKTNLEQQRIMMLKKTADLATDVSNFATMVNDMENFVTTWNQVQQNFDNLSNIVSSLQTEMQNIQTSLQQSVSTMVMQQNQNNLSTSIQM
jgi:flagellar capping protein FliD